MKTPDYQHDRCVQRGDVLQLITELQVFYASQTGWTVIPAEKIARDMQHLYLNVLELRHGAPIPLPELTSKLD